MKKKDKIDETPSVLVSSGQPDTALEIINKYGTYNIQPTADTDNDFPKIAQGLPKEENRKMVDKD